MTADSTVTWRCFRSLIGWYPISGIGRLAFTAVCCLIVSGLFGCGAGYVGVGGAVDQTLDDGSNSFTVFLEDCEPAMRVTSDLLALLPGSASSHPSVTLSFSASVDPLMVTVDRFGVTRMDTAGEFPVGELGISNLSIGDQTVTLTLTDDFAFDTTYKVSIDPSVRNASGQQLSGNTFGYFKVVSSQLRTFNEQVYAGVGLMGGFSLGSLGKAYATLGGTIELGGVENPQVIVANGKADGSWSERTPVYRWRHGDWELDDFIQEGFPLVPGAIVLGEQSAVIPILSRDTFPLTSETREYIVGLPGKFDSERNLEWPDVAESVSDPEIYRIDKGLSGSALRDPHQSSSPFILHCDSTPSIQGEDKYVAIWQSKSRFVENPTPGFADREIYYNSLTVSNVPGPPAQWGEQALLLSGLDKTVGRPGVFSWSNNGLGVWWVDFDTDGQTPVGFGLTLVDLDTDAVLFEAKHMSSEAIRFVQPVGLDLFAVTTASGVQLFSLDIQGQAILEHGPQLTIPVIAGQEGQLGGVSFVQLGSSEIFVIWGVDDYPIEHYLNWTTYDLATSEWSEEIQVLREAGIEDGLILISVFLDQAGFLTLSWVEEPRESLVHLRSSGSLSSWLNLSEATRGPLSSLFDPSAAEVIVDVQTGLFVVPRIAHSPETGKLLYAWTINTLMGDGTGCRAVRTVEEDEMP